MYWLLRTLDAGKEKSLNIWSDKSIKYLWIVEVLIHLCLSYPPNVCCNVTCLRIRTLWFATPIMILLPFSHFATYLHLVYITYNRIQELFHPK